MSGLTEQEVLNVLHAVECGDVTIPAADRRAAMDSFCGNVTFRLSNGWVFVIFNDCEEWDYIDSVTAPDGRSLTFEEFAGTGAEPPPMPLLYEYTPPVATCEALWGIPA